MKVFEFEGSGVKYVVLKCPFCKKVFRRNVENLKIFGNDVKNAKCQLCDKSFPVETNYLESDIVGFFDGREVSFSSADNLK